MNSQPHIAFDTVSAIGRVQEKKAIDNALSGPQNPSQAIIFRGPGGIGKTRLLRYAVDLADARDLLCSGIIDLYHSDMHSNSGIEQAILLGPAMTPYKDQGSVASHSSTGIDPQRNHFAGYWQQRAELTRARDDSFSAGRIEELRLAVTEEFIHNFNTLARQVAQEQQVIVLVFDTAEVVQFESDLIQRICQIQEKAVEVKGWITSVLPRLENCVILIAGRGPRTHVAHDPRDSLWKDIENALLPGLTCVSFDLQGLSQNETLAYFKALAKATRLKASEFKRTGAIEDEQSTESGEQANQLLVSAGALEDAATKLENLPDSDRLHIYEGTQGRPIRLSLTADIIVHGSIDGLFDQSAAWDVLEARVLDRLENTDVGFPVADTLNYLAYTRLGLNAELLHHLHSAWSLQECQSRLDAIQALSFVKTREGTDLVFLHDEMYDLLEIHRIRPDTDRRFQGDRHKVGYYGRIIEYYIQQLATTDPDTEAREYLEIALLHYKLRQNPREGYEFYARLDESAIKGHQTGRDMKLRDEVLRFFSVPYYAALAGRLGLTRAVIDRDCAVRWIKRHIALNDPRSAIAVAEIILRFGPQRFRSILMPSGGFRVDLSSDEERDVLKLFNSANSFFWSHLLTYYGEALILTAADIDRTEKVLQMALELLEEADDESADSLDEWLRTRILGKAHNNLGYHYRKHGQYGEANLHYIDALRYLRSAGIADEERDTRKNRAFLLGMIGHHHAAREQIDQVLQAEKNETIPYLDALDLNVSGYIYAWQGRPDLGVKECQRASTIAANLNEPRVRGLIDNGLGYCYRKWGDRWKFRNDAFVRPSKSEAFQLFQEAEGRLLEARHVLKDRDREGYWEACNELGSLYVDWAFLTRNWEEIGKTVQEYYEASIQFLTEALSVAVGVDHLVWECRDDLAQAYSDFGEWHSEQGDMLTAKEMWSKADEELTMIEAALIAWEAKEQVGFQTVSSGSGVNEWIALGKAHRQRGIWAFRELTRKKHVGTIETDNDTLLKEGVEEFARATLHFQQTRKSSQFLDDTVDFFVRRLNEAGVDGRLADQWIGSVERKYAGDLSIFRQEVADRVSI